jgi:hypothetical protein
MGLAKGVILFDLSSGGSREPVAKHRGISGFPLSNWLIAITWAIKQHASHLA